jgi:hypothetical protein
MAVLTVVHPSGDGSGLTAFIAGRPPVRVASPAALNALLDELDIAQADLLGLLACSRPDCGRAAVRVAMTVTAIEWRFAGFCETDGGIAPPGAALLAAGPVLRAAYRRDDPMDAAALARALIGAGDVPARLFSQPSCARCGRRIAPDPGPPGGLTWRTAGGVTSCGTHAAHDPAPGEVTSAITRHAGEARGFPPRPLAAS